MAIDDKFSDQNPGDKEYAEARELYDKRELVEGDFRHGSRLPYSDKAVLPVQAQLKSRAARGLSIGELAKRAGVRPSAIRYYEAEGIMPAPSRVSGRRIYANADAERLIKIVAARHLGFSIGDLRALKNATAADLKSVAQMRASQLRQTISALADNAARLDGLAYCRCDDGEPCVLT